MSGVRKVSTCLELRALGKSEGWKATGAWGERIHREEEAQTAGKNHAEGGSGGWGLGGETSSDWKERLLLSGAWAPLSFKFYTWLLFFGPLSSSMKLMWYEGQGISSTVKEATLTSAQIRVQENRPLSLPPLNPWSNQHSQGTAQHTKTTQHWIWGKGWWSGLWEVTGALMKEISESPLAPLRPCEDTASRQPSGNQEVCSYQTLSLPALDVRSPSLQNCAQ